MGAHESRALRKLKSYLSTQQSFAIVVLVTTCDSQGRTALVTGASAGIGLETARGLARLGYRVFVVGRNSSRTEAVAESLKRDFGASAEAFIADFSTLEDVYRLAKEVEAQTDSLELLVNNAGVWHQDYHRSKDGFEDTFAVNHLAPFVLTCALVPRLTNAAHARVVTVSSRLHRDGVFNPAHFDPRAQITEPFDGLEAYATSKFANVLFAFELARRLAKHTPHVVSTAVHPGAVNTNITRDSRLLSVGMQLVSPWIKTAADGAKTSLYAATNSALKHVTSAYFADCRQLPPDPASRKTSHQRALWRRSLEWTKLTPPLSWLDATEAG